MGCHLDEGILAISALSSAMQKENKGPGFVLALMIRFW
jgi:hypothetical protein